MPVVLLYFRLPNKISLYETNGITVLANLENVRACAMGMCKGEAVEGQQYDLIFTWSS